MNQSLCLDNSSTRVGLLPRLFINCGESPINPKLKRLKGLRRVSRLSGFIILPPACSITHVIQPASEHIIVYSTKKVKLIFMVGNTHQNLCLEPLIRGVKPIYSSFLDLLGYLEEPS